MKLYEQLHSVSRPQDIEITSNAVFVANDITPYEQQMDGRIINGYTYNCIEYTKDEYLLLQSTRIAALQEELDAAKILLGVD